MTREGYAQMKRVRSVTVMLTVLATAGLSLSAAPPAHATLERPQMSLVFVEPDLATGPTTIAAGRTCGLISVTDPLVPAGNKQIGLVYAGPLATTASTLATIEVRCTVQTGNNWRHIDADACAVASTVQTQVATLPPVAGGGLPSCSYSWAPQLQVWLCTQVTVNGTTSYWTGFGWSPSSASSCVPASEVQVPPAPFDPIMDVIDDVFVIPFVDPLICPILAALAPGVPGIIDIGPDGDVDVLGRPVWNCPPY